MPAGSILELNQILQALGITYLAEEIATGAFTDNKDSIRHERTMTTRSVRKIEDRLAGELQRVARRIEAEGLDVGSARQQYANAVTAVIQSAVQAAFIEGTAYVQRFAKQPLALTNSDLQAIQQRTQEFSEQFWRNLELEAKAKVIEPVRALPDVNATMSFLATNATFGLLNQSTMQKALQIQGEPELVWITELDFKVCPICRPIHGRTWKVGDPLILQPPRDSHPNCRCRLLLKEGGQIYSS